MHATVLFNREGEKIELKFNIHVTFTLFIQINPFTSHYKWKMPNSNSISNKFNWTLSLSLSRSLSLSHFRLLFFNLTEGDSKIFGLSCDLKWNELEIIFRRKCFYRLEICVQYALICMLESFSNPTIAEGQSSTPNKIDVFVNFDSVNGTSVRKKSNQILFWKWSKIALLFLLSSRNPKGKKNYCTIQSKWVTSIIMA